MPSIDWDKVNNRILVIGKFSDEKDKDGVRIGQDGIHIGGEGFIKTIKPVYYREFAPRLIQVSGVVDDGYAAFKFIRPAENTSNNAVPVHYPSPQGHNPPAPRYNEGPNISPSIEYGKEAYAYFYGLLQGFQKIISDEKFVENVLALLKQYLSNYFKEFRGNFADQDFLNNIVKENIHEVLVYLFSASQEELKLNNTLPSDDRDAVSKCICAFRTNSGDQSFNTYRTYLTNVCLFLSDPINLPSIILWLITERGGIQNDGSVMFNVLGRLAQVEFRRKASAGTLKPDYAKITGKMPGDLSKIDVGEHLKKEEEQFRAPLVVLTPELESDFLAAFQREKIYSKSAFRDTLVDNFSSSALILSKDGEAALRCAGEIIKVLYHPSIRVLAAEYWMKNKKITAPNDFEVIADCLGEDYAKTKSEWDQCASMNYSEQCIFFIERTKSRAFESLKNAVAHNYETMELGLMKSKIFYAALLNSGMAKAEEKYGLMPLPAQPFLLDDEGEPIVDYYSTYLEYYFEEKIDSIKNSVHTIAIEAGTAIAQGVLELVEANGLDSSKLRLFQPREVNKTTGTVPQAALTTRKSEKRNKKQSEPQQENSDNKKSINVGFPINDIPLFITKEIPLYAHEKEKDKRGDIATLNGKDIVFADYGKKELDEAVQTFKNCLEIASDEKTLRKVSRQWFSDSYQLISAKIDQGQQSVTDRTKRIEKHALPILLGNIIYSLPDAISNFSKPYIAQEYYILWSLVKEYGNPQNADDPDTAKAKLEKVCFETVYPILNQTDLGALFTYFVARCDQVKQIAEYTKLIDDLETLSKSGAEVWVINDTLDGYVNRNRTGSCLFWESANRTNLQRKVDETYIVYVTKDAGSTQTLQDYLTQNNNAAAQKIEFYPLFFFENTAECGNLSKAFSDFVCLNVGTIPEEPTIESCLWRTGVKLSPLLMLASSLLAKCPEGGNVQGLVEGNIKDIVYSGSIDVKNRFEAFITSKLFQSSTFFYEIYRQLWCYDDTLANTFIANRLRNIIHRGNLQKKWWEGFEYKAWDKNEKAFDTLPLIKALLTKTPKQPKVLNLKQIQSADEKMTSRSPVALPFEEDAEPNIDIESLGDYEWYLVKDYVKLKFNL